MSLGKFISGIIPIGAAIVYSPVKLYAKDSAPCHECRMKRLPKAHELPLYEKDEDNLKVEFVEKPPSALQSEIAGVRQYLSKYVTFIEDFGNRAVNVYETGVAHTQSTYDYLMVDSNRIPRFVAIASGGIAGFLFALRGGIIKKVIYPATGITLVSSAFYPQEAKDYVIKGFTISQDYVFNTAKDYGYEPEKIAAETGDRFESLKRTMRMDWLTTTLREQFNKRKASDSKKESLDLDKGDKKEDKEKLSS